MRLGLWDENVGMRLTLYFLQSGNGEGQDTFKNKKERNC